MLNDSLSTVYNTFSQPALQLVAACPSLRVCPGLPDPVWVAIGIQRALPESATGSAFLPTHPVVAVLHPIRTCLDRRLAPPQAPSLLHRLLDATGHRRGVPSDHSQFESILIRLRHHE